MLSTKDAQNAARPVGEAVRRPRYARNRVVGVALRPLKDRQHHTDERIRAVGDPTVNERFVRETEPVRDFLIRNALRLTHQRADAEDLVQDTLLKAYASFDNYREGTHLKSWLARIMSNAWIDKHRATQRRPAEQLSGELTAVTAPASSRVGTGGREESAETQALRCLPSDAERALRALPEDLRVIVYYACIADYRNTEIAALLQIPVGTVGSRLHRGKALLRVALSPPATL